MKDKAKTTAFLGLCTALALILAYVEVLLPPFFSSVPGIKMGLPNIAVIFVLYRFGAPEAVLVSVVRVIVISVLFGNPATFIYSMAGALLSIAAMAILKKTDLLSAVGVSVAGGVFHNVGQILVAIFMLGAAEVGYYIVALAVSGIISGILIGLCGALMIKKLPTYKI